MPTPTLEQKKQFLEDLKMLTQEQYAEVFRIVKLENVKFTENSNGIFFDLNTTEDAAFEKMLKFMDLCKAQRDEDKARGEEITHLREEANALVDSKNRLKDSH